MADLKISELAANGTLDGSELVEMVQGGVNVKTALSAVKTYVTPPTATASVTGLLSSSNWTTFNNKASLASPTFTGTPSAPTADSGTNTTQLATTAFVTAATSGLNLTVGALTTASANGATISAGQLRLAPASSTTPGVVDIIAQTFVGAKTFQNIISGPTAAPGTVTTQLASTAFVGTAITNAALAMGGLTTSAANGATITSGQLRLGVASASYPGIVNTVAQTFEGIKSFLTNAWLAPYPLK